MESKCGRKFVRERKERRITENDTSEENVLENKIKCVI
jgi:hypothetical protein